MKHLEDQLIIGVNWLNEADDVSETKLTDEFRKWNGQTLRLLEYYKIEDADYFKQGKPGDDLVMDWKRKCAWLRSVVNNSEGQV